jgi:hypothetical protein
MSFLNRGLRVTGTSNSDSHTASLQSVGYPRTYLQVGSDDPSTLTDAQVMAAIRANKVTISGGPFVTLSVGSKGIGDLAQPDFSGATPVAKLHVTIQAPPWMGPLDRMDVWQGDATSSVAHIQTSVDLRSAPSTQVVRYDDTVSVPVTADTWFLVTVRGPVDSTTGFSNALWPVVQTSDPLFAITNPIYIDYDADGVWTPIR